MLSSQWVCFGGQPQKLIGEGCGCSVLCVLGAFLARAVIATVGLSHLGVRSAGSSTPGLQVRASTAQQFENAPGMKFTLREVFGEHVCFGRVRADSTCGQASVGAPCCRMIYDKKRDGSCIVCTRSTSMWWNKFKHVQIIVVISLVFGLWSLPFSEANFSRHENIPDQEWDEARALIDI